MKVEDYMTDWPTPNYQFSNPTYQVTPEQLQKALNSLQDTLTQPNGDQPNPQDSPSTKATDDTITDIYLAGSWARKYELRDYRNVLEALGYTVTSQWLDEGDSPHSVFTPDTPSSHDFSARRDLQDIEASDLVVCFTSSDPTALTIGGGRHFESGFAYALGIPIVYVGAREHVFHYLHSALVLKTVNDLYLWLLVYPDTFELEERLANAGTWA